MLATGQRPAGACGAAATTMALGPGFRSRAVARFCASSSRQRRSRRLTEPAGRATTASRGDAASAPDGSLKAERGSDKVKDATWYASAALPSWALASSSTALTASGLLSGRALGSAEKASAWRCRVQPYPPAPSARPAGRRSQSRRQRIVGAPCRQRYIVDSDLGRVRGGRIRCGRRIGHAERHVRRRMSGRHGLLGGGCRIRHGKSEHSQAAGRRHRLSPRCKIRQRNAAGWQRRDDRLRRIFFRPEPALGNLRISARCAFSGATMAMPGRLLVLAARPASGF